MCDNIGPGYSQPPKTLSISVTDPSYFQKSNQVGSLGFVLSKPPSGADGMAQATEVLVAQGWQPESNP